MKKAIKSTIAIVLVFLLAFSVVSCKKEEEEKEVSLWDNATYLEDKEFGSGEKTVTVEVKAEDRKVTFTINTDKATVGEALMEHDLIAGEQGDYGLYVKAVNGITADYDADKAYWAFYIDSEYATSGVDATEINEDAIYSLEYTK